MSSSSPSYQDLIASHRYEDLDAKTTEALAINPLDTDAWYYRAESQKMQMRYAPGLKAALKVLRINPHHLAAKSVLVQCAGQLGLEEWAAEMVEGFEYYYDGVQQSWSAIFYRELGLYEKALASIENVIAAFPGEPFPVQIKGNIEMCMGRFDQGIEDYRQYVSVEFFNRYRPGMEEAGWDMSRYWCGEDPAGKTFLVVPHGGVGDMIQFVRYAKCLKKMGAKKVLIGPPTPRVAKLLGSCHDIEIGLGITPDQYDYLTDPYGLWLNLYTRFGYLSVDKYLTAPESAFSKRMVKAIQVRANGKRLMGLSWCSDMADGAPRSVPLGQLLPLFALPNVHWVILQRGWALREFEQSPMAPHCTVVPESASFDDTAGIVEHLEGVVTIESYMTHLAGAIGKPVYFMASRALDGRHGNAERHSPWYPKTKIARQPEMGDWRSVVRSIVQDLQEAHEEANQRTVLGDQADSAASLPHADVINPILYQRTLFIDVSGLDLERRGEEPHEVVAQLIREWAQLETRQLRICLVSSEQGDVPHAPDQVLTRRLLGKGLESSLSFQTPVSGDLFLITSADPAYTLARQRYYESLIYKGVRVIALVQGLTPVFYGDLFASKQVGEAHIYARFILGLNGILCLSQTLAHEILALAKLNHIVLDTSHRVVWAHPGANFEALTQTQVMGMQGSGLMRTSGQSQDDRCFVTYSDLGPASGLNEILDAFESLWENNKPVRLFVITPQATGVNALSERLANHLQISHRLIWSVQTHQPASALIGKQGSCFIDNSIDKGHPLALTQAVAQGMPLLLRDTPVHREMAPPSARFYAGLNSSVIAQEVNNFLGNSLTEQSEHSAVPVNVNTWSKAARHFWSVFLELAA